MDILDSQNDKSIITRIETSAKDQTVFAVMGQNDKSIITRIETLHLLVKI